MCTRKVAMPKYISKDTVPPEAAVIDFFAEMHSRSSVFSTGFRPFPFANLRFEPSNNGGSFFFSLSILTGFVR